MDRFLRGLREGSAQVPSPQAISQQPNSSLISGIQSGMGLDAAQQPDSFFRGIADAMGSVGNLAQDVAAPATNPFGFLGMGVGESFDASAATDSLFQAEKVSAPTQDGTFEVQQEVYADGAMKYNNFPQREITIDELTPHVLWALDEQGIRYHDNLSSYIFGVVYVPLLDEQGNQQVDKNGNPLWQPNPVEEGEWTAEQREKKRLAEAEMAQVNYDISMVNQGAESQDWDYRNPGQLIEDGAYEGGGGLGIGAAAGWGLEQLGRPTEWIQNSGADLWYRKHVLGEELTAKEMAILTWMEGRSGVGNAMGTVGGWVTPGTDNRGVGQTFEGFNDWAAKQDPEFLRRIYEEGWDPDNDGEGIIYGGNALWDVYAHTRTGTQRIFVDTLTDPLTMIPGAGRAMSGGGRLLALGTDSATGMRVARGMDKVGRGAVLGDDAVGQIFMKPLVEGVKLPFRAVGAMFPDVSTGWNAGRWNQVGDAMMRKQLKSADPNEIPMNALGRHASTSGVEYSPVSHLPGEAPREANARRLGFEVDALGEDALPTTGARFNRDTMTRTERFFNDLSQQVNRRVARITSQDAAGDVADVVAMMDAQSRPESRQGFIEDLARVGRRNGDILDRETNTILSQVGDPTQQYLHRKLAREGYHPLVPGRSRYRVTNEALRKEWSDIHDSLDPAALGSKRSAVAKIMADVKAELPPSRGVADHSEPIEETFADLGVLAPQMDRAKRGLANRRIEEIYEILKDNPYALQRFFQEYREVDGFLASKGLVDRGSGGYVRPDQTIMSQWAIEEAWRRSFRGSWLESRLPKYEYKDFDKGTVQRMRKEAGEFSVNSAYESIVHGSERDAQAGFIYLHRMGFSEFAEEAEAYRWAMNQAREESGMSGSYVFRNQDTDGYFTHKDPSRDWDPRKGLDDKIEYGAESLRDPQQRRVTDLEGAPIHGPMRAPVGPQRSSPFGMEHTDLPNLRSADAQSPIPQDRSLAIPGESIRSVVARGLRQDGVDQRVRNIKQAIENGEEIPQTVPDPEPFNPAPYVLDDAPVQRVPEAATIYQELVKDPNARFYRLEDPSPETIADAAQRVNVLRASGAISEEQYNYWYRSTNANYIEMFKHLSMSAMRGHPHPEADGLYDLSTPMGRFKRGGLKIRESSDGFSESIRNVLESSSRNDNLELSDRVIRAIEKEIVGEDQLGGLKIPELSAPEWARNRFGRQLRSIENAETILQTVGFDSRRDEARSLIARTMHSLTSPRESWPMSLKNMLDAVGMGVARDLESSAAWMGYSFNVDDATNRLVALTRHVVAGHYLSEGVATDDAARLMRNILPEIDQFAEDFLRTSTVRYNSVRDAKRWLSDRGFLKYTHRVRRGNHDVVGIQGMPDVADNVLGSYQATAIYIMRSLGESTGHLDANDVAKAFDVDGIGPGGKTPPGWRGAPSGETLAGPNQVSRVSGGVLSGDGVLLEGPVPSGVADDPGLGVSTQKLDGSPVNTVGGEDPHLWAPDRFRAELDNARELQQEHNAHYASWSILSMEKDDFLNNAGTAFRREITEELGTDPIGASARDVQEATDAVYDRAYAGAVEYRALNRYLERIAVEKLHSNEIDIDTLRGLLKRRVEDPRGIAAPDRTPMQERQSLLLDTAETQKHRLSVSQRRHRDWIAKHRADGDTDLADAREKQMLREAETGEIDVIQDGAGYVRLSGQPAQFAREINKQIRLAADVRKRWGDEAISDGLHNPRYDRALKTVLGEMSAIRKSLPELDKLMEEHAFLSDRLRDAPRPKVDGKVDRSRLSPAQRNRYLSSTDRKKLNSRRNKVVKDIRKIEVESGLADRWLKMNTLLFEKDELLKFRIRKVIKVQQENMDAELALVRKRYKDKTLRNQEVNRIQTHYLGKLKTSPKGKQTRDGTGIISKLEAEHEALMLDQGYPKANPVTGSRGKLNPENSYRGVQLQVGRMLGKGEMPEVQQMLWLADAAHKEVEADPRKVRRAVAQKARRGHDLEPWEEEVMKQIEVDRLNKPTPGEIQLVQSPSAYLAQDGGIPRELMPSRGGDMIDPQREAEEVYNGWVKDIQAGLREGPVENLPTIQDIAHQLEMSAMADEGYVWLDSRAYAPIHHPVLRDGLINGTGDFFSVVDGHGNVFTDLFDLLDVYPDLGDEIRTGVRHLRLYREEYGGNTRIGSLDKMEGADWIPAQVEKPFEILMSKKDEQIYTNFIRIREMSPEAQHKHLTQRVDEILKSDDENVKMLFREKLLDAAVQDHLSWPSHIDTLEDPVDEAVLRSLFKAIVENTGDVAADHSDLTDAKIRQALHSQVFKEELQVRLKPESVVDPQTIEAPKNVDGGWFSDDLLDESRIRRVKASAAAGDVVEEAAEQASPTTHRRRGRSVVAKSRTRKVHDGWLEKKGPVTSGEVDSAYSFLDSLETFDSGQVLGFMYHSPYERKLAARRAQEASEDIVRQDILSVGESRYADETAAIQKARNERVRQGSPKKRDKDGSLVSIADDLDFGEVRPVQNQDRFIIDSQSVSIANTFFRGEGYYKGMTYLEGYKLLRGRINRDIDTYVKLANKSAHGGLSRDEAREYTRLGTRLERYGSVTTENASRGQRIEVERGVSRASHRRTPMPTDNVLDMDMYRRNEDFAVDIMVRKELEDLIYQDMSRDLVSPRWARLIDKYDQMIGSWSKWKLLNPLNLARFVGLNTIGDYGQMLMTGHKDAVFQSLKGIGNGELKSLFREASPRALGDIGDTQLGKLLSRAGLGPNASEVRGSLTGHLSKHVDTSVRDLMPSGELAPLVKNAGNKFQSYSDYASALTTSLEWNRRYALFATDFQRRMIRRHDALSIEILERSKTMGLDDVSMQDITVMVKDLDYGMSSKELYDRMVLLGGGRSQADTATIKKWADRVARDWANGQKKSMDEAVNTVNSVLFSYRLTDIDEVVRKFVPFHFWATRALPLYAEIAVRNPYLLSAYARAVNGMENRREAGETPGFMDNVMEFWMSPSGFSAFTNPLSAIGLVSLFADTARSEGVSDETIVGTFTRILGDYGGMNLYPWFNSALNMMGFYGATNRGLDPTGFARERRFLGGIVQMMGSQGMLPGDTRKLLGKPFEQRLREGRAFLTDLIPGFDRIEATNANAANEVSFQYLMENEIRERDGLSPTAPLSVSQQEEIVLAWENPDDPLYRRALDKYSQGNMLNNVINSVMPMYLTIQPENSSYLDHQMKQDQPLPQGVPMPPGGRAPGEGYEVTGYTRQEQAWLDAWYRATGEEYKDGDLDQWKRDTKLRQDLLWLTPEAQGLVIHKYKYDNLGTREQQKTKDMYYQITYGTLPDYGTLTVGDKVIGYWDVNHMSQNERRALAREWVEADEKRNEGWLQLLDLQKAYNSSNPELNEYTTWRYSVNNYDSLGAYRQSVSAENPNAARYFSQQRKDLVAKYGTDVEKINYHLDIRTTSMEAYFAIHGYRYSRTDPDPLSSFESGFDPIGSPRESSGPSGMLGEANTYLTDLYGTTVRLETMPAYIREPMIGLLPEDMQDSVRRELRD